MARRLRSTASLSSTATPASTPAAAPPQPQPESSSSSVEPKSSRGNTRTTRTTPAPARGAAANGAANASTTRRQRAAAARSNATPYNRRAASSKMQRQQRLQEEEENRTVRELDNLAAAAAHSEDISAATSTQVSTAPSAAASRSPSPSPTRTSLPKDQRTALADAVSPKAPVPKTPAPMKGPIAGLLGFLKNLASPALALLQPSPPKPQQSIEFIIDDDKSVKSVVMDDAVSPEKYDDAVEDHPDLRMLTPEKDDEEDELEAEPIEEPFDAENKENGVRENSHAKHDEEVITVDEEEDIVIVDSDDEPKPPPPKRDNKGKSKAEDVSTSAATMGKRKAIDISTSAAAPTPAPPSLTAKFLSPKLFSGAATTPAFVFGGPSTAAAPASPFTFKQPAAPPPKPAAVSVAASEKETTAAATDVAGAEKHEGSSSPVKKLYFELSNFYAKKGDEPLTYEEEERVKTVLENNNAVQRPPVMKPVSFTSKSVFGQPATYKSLGQALFGNIPESSHTSSLGSQNTAPLFGRPSVPAPKPSDTQSSMFAPIRTPAVSAVANVDKLNPVQDNSVAPAKPAARPPLSRITSQSRPLRYFGASFGASSNPYQRRPATERRMMALESRTGADDVHVADIVEPKAKRAKTFNYHEDSTARLIMDTLEEMAPPPTKLLTSLDDDINPYRQEGLAPAKVIHQVPKPSVLAKVSAAVRDIKAKVAHADGSNKSKALLKAKLKSPPRSKDTSISNNDLPVSFPVVSKLTPEKNPANDAPIASSGGFSFKPLETPAKAAPAFGVPSKEPSVQSTPAFGFSFKQSATSAAPAAATPAFGFPTKPTTYEAPSVAPSVPAFGFSTKMSDVPATPAPPTPAAPLSFTFKPITPAAQEPSKQPAIPAFGTPKPSDLSASTTTSTLPPFSFGKPNEVTPKPSTTEPAQLFSFRPLASQGAAPVAAAAPATQSPFAILAPTPPAAAAAPVTATAKPAPVDTSAPMDFSETVSKVIAEPESSLPKFTFSSIKPTPASQNLDILKATTEGSLPTFEFAAKRRASLSSSSASTFKNQLSTTPAFSPDKPFTFQPVAGLDKMPQIRWGSPSSTPALPTTSATTPATAAQPARAITPPSSLNPPGSGFQFNFNKWVCAACSTQNTSEKDKCASCDASKPGAAAPFAPAASAVARATGSPWICSPGCCTENSCDTEKCSSCGAPRPKIHSTPPLFKVTDNWSCGTCLSQNPADKNKCLACDAAKPGSVTAAASAPAAFSWPIRSGASDKWSCGTCLTQNPADKTKCMSCEAAKPGATPKESTSAPAAAPSFGWPVKTGGADKWSCGTCLTQNPVDKTKCLSCEASRPESAATAPATSAPAPAFAWPLKSSGGGDKWSCGTCLSQNPVDKTKCMSCEAPKPGATSTATASTAPPLGFSWLKPASDKWSCGTCLSQNPADKTKCLSCEAPKPGAATSTATSLAVPSSTAPLAFTWTPPAPATTATTNGVAKPAGLIGGWGCTVCSVRDKEEAAKCVACEALKPSTTADQSKPKTFSTDVNWDKIIGRPSTQTEEKPANAGFTFTGASTTTTTASTGFKFGSANAGGGDAAASSSGTGQGSGFSSTGSSAAFSTPASSGFVFKPAQAAAPSAGGFTFNPPAAQATAPSTSGFTFNPPAVASTAPSTGVFTLNPAAPSFTPNGDNAASMTGGSSFGATSAVSADAAPAPGFTANGASIFGSLNATTPFGTVAPRSVFGGNSASGSTGTGFVFGKPEEKKSGE